MSNKEVNMARRGLCKCCRRMRVRNERELCRDCAVCLHCESASAVCELGLCEQCGGQECIRELYRRGYHWSPEWEMHLRRKTAEMQRLLRLHESDEDWRKKLSS